MNDGNMNQINSDILSVKNVLEQFRTGWEKSDADQILSTIARREDVVIYGTDLVEHWIGYNDFEEPVKSQVTVLKEPRYSWGKGEPRICIQRDVAWASGDLTVKFKTDGDAQKIQMRSTYVLSKKEIGWKIVQAHFSIGQEEAVVEY